ncbi:MAG TPA: long-chain fatty acid--CoA ligase [Candidatus Aminicenantes bacterium]|nr:long-chain fatty acid--CoA ligase [Candidatus Aminicenantes bacterium]HRY64227.1 long-chain fatty acid--CoA ligase [Candidatus Aminicenantes bacterium]HRZ71140.1 long-chain fatty acid--CoA ligase [Candidatus Aminicenantes bacterium]
MVETLSQAFLNTVKTYIKPDLMAAKADGRYVPIPTDEYARRVRHLSLGLADLGLGPGDKLILLSENRPEWNITDVAVLCAGGVTVPIYTSLMPEQIKYMINDSEAKIVVCSNRNLWLKVEAIRSALPKVNHYVLIDEEGPEGVLSLSEIAARGRTVEAADPGLFEKRALAVKPDDVASIVYTSGTTGIPKGVMLTHANFLANVVSLDAVTDFSVKDTILSFLPLSHVLERMTTFSFLYKGASIYYAESIETVGENLLEVRPTIMISVPRVFDKIYAKVMDNVLEGSALKRKLFFWAVGVGKKYGARHIRHQPIPWWLRVRRGVAAKLVFSKIIAKTGGRVHFFVSGGAPLSADVAEFFYAVGITILEGYGLTETSPVLACNTFPKMKFGTVGPLVPGVQVKFAPDGEIWAKGPNVMKGYYNKPQETAEVFEDGWFKTGDVGHFDEEGFLVITDRKKDILVTAGGKNVSPQPIENMLRMNPYIQNVVVVGGGRKFISALVVPNFDKLEAYAKSRGISFGSRKELVESEEIRSFMLAEINRSTPNLASYERIKKIVLLDKDFDADTQMTPSLKVKRHIVEKVFKPLIDLLYKD